MSHDKSQKTHLLAQIHLLLSASAQYKRVRYNLKLPSCVWFRPETKAIMWLATLLTPVVAGRKYIPLQSLVPVTTFRCHFFVSHPAYPSFWGWRQLSWVRPFTWHPPSTVRPEDSAPRPFCLAQENQSYYFPDIPCICDLVSKQDHR